jgi:hypothetical protein
MRPSGCTRVPDKPQELSRLNSLSRLHRATAPLHVGIDGKNFPTVEVVLNIDVLPITAAVF